jgi:hypothetical protein
MKASIGDQKYRGPLPDDLGYSYLDFSIQLSKDGYLYFSKLEILKNLPLLFNLSEKMAKKLMPDVTHICLLASSGMALGVCIGLIAKLPILFYKQEGWPMPEAHGLGPRFFPGVPLNARITLVDSHEHTRYTSALCYDELAIMGVQVVQSITPISFDNTIDPTWTKYIDYSSLNSFSELIEHVAQKYSSIVTVDELTKIINATDNRFWLAPPIRRKDFPYYEFDAPGIKERPLWFLGSNHKPAHIETINSRLSYLLPEKISPSDEGRWAFFLDPLFVEKWAKIAGDHLHLDRYDYLIGAGHLGTALAISLAYYNQDKFTGKIVSYLGRDGFVPVIPDLRGKKVLPIEMIITTGVYAVDIFHRVLGLGGRIDNYVTVFRPTQSRNWFIQSRLTSLSRLVDRGIKFLAFA